LEHPSFARVVIAAPTAPLAPTQPVLTWQIAMVTGPVYQRRASSCVALRASRRTAGHCVRLPPDSWCCKSATGRHRLALRFATWAASRGGAFSLFA